jgi:hypothetical protein
MMRIAMALMLSGSLLAMAAVHHPPRRHARHHVIPLPPPRPSTLPHVCELRLPTECEGR